jgi:glutamate-1-semialdehyde aminotransferase
MLASRVMMEHLVAEERQVYPLIARLGEKARRAVEEAFRAEGIHAVCTGSGNDALPDSSMAAVHFPYDATTACDAPEQTRNPDVCDVELSDTVLQLALLLEDVFVMHGLGSVSAAHTEEDIARLGEACRSAGRRIAPFL